MQNMMLKRRMVRRFKRKQPSLKDIEKIIDAARLAPVTLNEQYIECVVVKDTILTEEISKEITYRFIKGKDRDKPPVYIAVLINLFKDTLRGKTQDALRYAADTAASATTMMYMAQSLGIDCWLISNEKTREKVGQILKVPPYVIVKSLLGIGY